MKKFLFLIVFTFCTTLGMYAQQTPDEIIPLWQHRYVPSADNVDSTFNSIVFKTEKDSFSYVDVMNFTDNSSVYGSTNIDTMTVLVSPIKATDNITYIAVALTAKDVTGYPGFGASKNVCIVNTASNSYFDTADTLTVTVEFEVYTPSGAGGVDSIKTSIYTNSVTSGVSGSTTKYVDNAQTWTTKTVTLSLPRPTDQTAQSILIVLLPKFTAVDQVCYIANVRAKISN